MQGGVAEREMGSWVTINSLNWNTKWMMAQESR